MFTHFFIGAGNQSAVGSSNRWSRNERKSKQKESKEIKAETNTDRGTGAISKIQIN